MNFEAVLKPIIVADQLSHCMHYIGSTGSDEPPKNILHDVAILEFNNIYAKNNIYTTLFTVF